MRLKATLIGFCLLTGMLIAAGVFLMRHRASAPTTQDRQTFHVNGVVRSLEPGGRTVVIEHEDIPEFMPAMTMPFEVNDPALLRGLKPGDAVRFELVVTKDTSWISALEHRTEAGATNSNAPTPPPRNGAPAEPAVLVNGQPVPDFTLTNQNGSPFHLRDYRGKAVLLTFVYTRCPLPNYCPLMSKNFADLQSRLTKAFPGRFHLLTVSFDPEYDTPEVLKRYAQAFTRDESTWSFVSGGPEQIHQVASEFGLVYLPDAGTFTHDLRTALIGPDGRLVHVWRSNVWTPYEVQRRVAEVLETPSGSPLAAAGGSKSPYPTPLVHD